jgi:hypothetical protein
VSIDLRKFPLARLSPGELIRALSTKLEKDASTDKFAGTVLLAKDDKPIFTGFYGMADREQEIPNTLSTKLRIGSMNKVFTAVSIPSSCKQEKSRSTIPSANTSPTIPTKKSPRKSRSSIC